MACRSNHAFQQNRAFSASSIVSPLGLASHRESFLPGGRSSSPRSHGTGIQVESHADSFAGLHNLIDTHHWLICAILVQDKTRTRPDAGRRSVKVGGFDKTVYPWTFEHARHELFQFFSTCGSVLRLDIPEQVLTHAVREILLSCLCFGLHITPQATAPCSVCLASLDIPRPSQTSAYMIALSTSSHAEMCIAHVHAQLLSAGQLLESHKCASGCTHQQ